MCGRMEEGRQVIQAEVGGTRPASGTWWSNGDQTDGWMDGWTLGQMGRGNPQEQEDLSPWGWVFSP